ncbi:uroporphyrinogen decarboxylase family protein [Clostridium estertheticum]|uniref:uroporphyrinogen decarboxylase family protein n=1 Tax=Clostridium estertheticum TaxID=238834 RepID=UPI001CF4FC00|nr:uroporphyrinogen decarboxylase family protein [Clostridium estertheticum]MCB2355621.1 methylcobamide--CoM methyltransferase [Clostridium estertheticum]WAG39259.1 methylcobamide--CoM methyltransferase [Clostridium estertheticum]
MNDLTPKERIQRTFKKQTVDRPPIICPGGMMNSAIVEVMNKTGHKLPQGHHDSRIMAEIANDVHQNTGFENFGIPFCMTVEAEVLGSEINYGNLFCEPKIQKEVFATASDVVYKELGAMEKNQRVNSIIDATYTLSKKYPDVPVIGSLTGPISTAASLVDPISFLKELRKNPSIAHSVIEYVSNHIIELAKLMIENGANVISIADPTATGEILGPKMFDEYAVRYLNKIINAVHAMNTPVIVHICGKMSAVKKYIPKIKSDAISTDSSINLKILKDEYQGLTTMGNVSTYLLEFGDEEKIANQTARLVNDGINIISPACGLSTSTPLKNIESMTKIVKGS